METWGWEEGDKTDPKTGFILPMFLETFAVVFIKDGAPGIDVNDGHGTRDEQHERELHHVADLHQHDGGDEGQHGDVVVILGVLYAAILHSCSAVDWSRVVLQTAKLEGRTVAAAGRTEGTGGQQTTVRDGCGTALSIQLPLRTAPSETLKDGKIHQGAVQKPVVPTKSLTIPHSMFMKFQCFGIVTFV